MRRKDGKEDARFNYPVLGYVFYENNFRCPKCHQEVPDDSLACPWCLDKSPNPAAAPNSRRKKMNTAAQERLPLNGFTKLD